MGLVDAIVREDYLVEVAERFVDKGLPKPVKLKLNLVSRILERTPFGRKVLFSQARKQTLSKTRGNYPAAEAIIDVIAKTSAGPLSKRGMDVEAEAFGQLVMSPQSEALRHLFFATTEMKKAEYEDGVTPTPIQKAAVSGRWSDGRWYCFCDSDESKGSR